MSTGPDLMPISFTMLKDVPFAPDTRQLKQYNSHYLETTPTDCGRN